MCDLILVTVLKMRPHYSQSSREIDYEQSLFFSWFVEQNALVSRAWTPLAKSEEKERLLAV